MGQAQPSTNIGRKNAQATMPAFVELETRVPLIPLFPKYRVTQQANASE